MAEKWRIIESVRKTISEYPHLERHKIPSGFEYTHNLVRLLTRIAQTKPFLEEHLGQPLQVQLLRQAKIRAITFSNQIEGNKLEERGVTRALESKSTGDDDKDVIEVRNYSDALEYAEALAQGKRALRTRDLCDLQKLVTRELLHDKRQSGHIRSIKVDIVDANSGKKIDECPEPHFLSELLDDLWSWLERQDEVDPFVRAFAFHYLGVAIHPFADGNGRTMRLMQHLLLLRGGEQIARFVPSETAIMMTRDRYYSTIRQCKALGSLNPVVEYLAECFAVAAEGVIKEGKALVKKSLDRKPEARREKILALSKQKKEFTVQDVIQLLEEVPRRTLERDLQALVNSKALKAIGQKKARSYSR